MTFLILVAMILLGIVLLPRGWSAKKQIGVLFLCVLSSIGLLILVESVGTPTWIPKGDQKSQTWSWQDAGLFFSMIMGMAAKYLFDAIGEKNKIHFEKWQLFKPMLVAPIVFVAFYATVNQESSFLMTIGFSFQNGFFWQTVLGEKKKATDS